MLVGGAAGVALLAYRRRQQPASDEESSLAATPAEPVTAPEPTIDDAPYSTDAIQAACDECYKIAFGVKTFDYQIFGEHAAVMERVRESAAQSIHQRDYFPRRPMLLS